MEDRFKDISANNDLDFYLNVKNISNSNFTFDIIEYFESGERKIFFKYLKTSKTQQIFVSNINCY